MIFFTSDLHLGHKGIIEFCNRPFRDTAEMLKVLIQNYNSIVGWDDTVYILGDLTYKLPLDEANNIIGLLNGRKHLICGNHDMKYDGSLFEEVCEYKQIFTYGRHFTLMHYPLLEWSKMRGKSIHLHGHMHNQGMEYNLQCKSQGIRRYDVGVDANGYYPIAITTVLDFMDRF